MLSQRSQSVSSLAWYAGSDAARRRAVSDRQPGQCPALEEAQLEGATLVAPSLVVIGRGHVRDHRLQPRRSGQGRLPLGQPDVRPAEGADPPVRPWLLADPGAGVVAVVRLVREGVERALGCVPPANILADQHIPLAGRADPERGGSCRPVVGGAGEDDGIPPRPARPVDICIQHRAIPHRHRHAAINRNGIPRNHPSPS